MKYININLIFLLILASSYKVEVQSLTQKGRRTKRASRDSNLLKRRQQMREMQRKKLLRENKDSKEKQQQQHQKQTFRPNPKAQFESDVNGDVIDLDGYNEDTKMNSTTTSLPKIVIVEPPQNAFIQGSNFFVSVRVEVDESSEKIWEKNYSESFVCISLDEAPWHCWPTSNGRIHFSQALDGSHTIRAKIYNNETFVDEINTEQDEVSFTIVHDPDMIRSNETTISYEKRNKRETGNETEIITINVPVVQMISPADKVTYSGSKVHFQSHLAPKEPELFQQYFNHSFVCINIDAATAHSCFPIYGYSDDVKTVPFITGIEPGYHTFEVSISHPVTRDLIEVSSSGTKAFFVTGENNEAAVTTVSVKVDGNIVSIPIAKGTDPLAQAKYFCSSIYLVNDEHCISSVSQRVFSAIGNTDISANSGNEKLVKPVK